MWFDADYLVSTRKDIRFRTLTKRIEVDHAVSCRCCRVLVPLYLKAVCRLIVLAMDTDATAVRDIVEFHLH